MPTETQILAFVIMFLAGFFCGFRVSVGLLLLALALKLSGVHVV